MVLGLQQHFAGFFSALKLNMTEEDEVHVSDSVDVSRQLLLLTTTFFICHRLREFWSRCRASGWLPSAGLDLLHLDPGIRRTSVDIVRWDICFPGKREPALIGVCIWWVEFSPPPPRFFHFEKPYNFPIVGTTNPLLSLISQHVIMLGCLNMRQICCVSLASVTVTLMHPFLHIYGSMKGISRRNLMKFEPCCMEDTQYAWLQPRLQDTLSLFKSSREPKPASTPPTPHCAHFAKVNGEI